MEIKISLSASLNGHCKSLPQFFATIYEKQYNDWQGQKKAKPTLQQEKISKCSDKLFDALSFWDSSRKSVTDNFFKGCRELAESLHTYADYLKKSSDRVAAGRDRESPFDDVLNENVSLPRAAVKVNSLQDSYKKLNNFMLDKDLYDPVHIALDTFSVPEKRRDRYLWFENLRLTHRLLYFLYFLYFRESKKILWRSFNFLFWF